MPFGVMNGVGLGMGVLDGVMIVEGEGAVLRVNLGRPIVTNGAFASRSSQTTLRTCYLVTYYIAVKCISKAYMLDEHFPLTASIAESGKASV